MVKQLYMLRHSDTAPHHDDGDHARELTEHGVSLCIDVAEHFAKSSIAPSYTISSTATRTVQTATYVLGHDDFASEQSLYLASPETILQLIHSIDDTHDSALIIGHNPGLHALCVALDNGKNRNASAQLRAQFPSPALACFHCDVDSWGFIQTGTNKLESFHIFG